MGIWGPRTFDNDFAFDLLEDVESTGAWAIGEALEALTTSEPEAPLENEPCARAIAAAEIVAGRVGQGSPELPPDVVEWCETSEWDAAPLRATAARAVNLARSALRSELRKFWTGRPDSDAWAERLADLERRLA